MNKLPDSELFVRNSCNDIFTVSETWLKVSNSEALLSLNSELNVLKCVLASLNRRRGGRVAVLVRKSVNVLSFCNTLSVDSGRFECSVKSH